ncbi:hemolysin D [Paenibacillus peoriae]|uniref:HlyD family secretion protein n=1 Tax=Paenibacillus sp. FSL R10-2748 TaxID=2954658 RepID=UPI00096C98C5|nr:HlyD family efflux transporter periplasmic adaptor subunit [Paenibacillus peoriae]OMF70427.1 hemolysin D [Paenibacillus peoriae]OMF81427.1 hemolysin D [Paenibacillus peoriae]
MGKKKIYAVLIVLFILSGGALGYYYWYQGTHYVTSEDARIAADQYKVMPLFTAKLNHIYVEEGDTLKQNEMIAVQDISGLDSSSVNKAVIRAPIDGSVIKIYSQEQEIASPSSAVAIMTDMENLYVLTSIEETDISRIKPGTSVDVTLDAAEGQVIQGKVSKIGQASNSLFSVIPATNTSGNFNKVTQRVPVKIALNIPDDMQLIPGTNVKVRIHTP